LTLKPFPHRRAAQGLKCGFGGAAQHSGISLYIGHELRPRTLLYSVEQVSIYVNIVVSYSHLRASLQHLKAERCQLFRYPSTLTRYFRIRQTGSIYFALRRKEEQAIPSSKPSKALDKPEPREDTIVSTVGVELQEAIVDKLLPDIRLKPSQRRAHLSIDWMIVDCHNGVLRIIPTATHGL
jgi:hypothetical protein